MNMRGRLNKPKAKPTRQKKPVLDADDHLEKELLEVYDLLLGVAKLLEESQQTARFNLGTRYVRRVQRVELSERKEEPERDEKHIARAITNAETWPQRDRVARRLAAFCYGLAKDLLRINDQKNAQRWMGLSQRFFKLSMDPKAKQDMEKVLTELSELKATMKEHEEKQECEDDEEPGDG